MLNKEQPHIDDLDILKKFEFKKQVPEKNDNKNEIFNEKLNYEDQSHIDDLEILKKSVIKKQVP